MTTKLYQVKYIAAGISKALSGLFLGIGCFRRLYLELVAYVATGSFFSNKKSKKPLEPISIDEIISEAARSLLEYTDRHDIRYDDKFALFINIARSGKYSDKVLKECYYKVLGYTTTITFKND